MSATRSLLTQTSRREQTRRDLRRARELDVLGKRARVAPQADDLEWSARVGSLEYVRAWGPWHWWVTLTFRRKVSPTESDDAFRAWACYVARVLVAQHLRVAWVTDVQPTSGHLHIHALLGFDAPVPSYASPSDALRDWRAKGKERATSWDQNDAQWLDPTQAALPYTFLKHSNAMWAIACSRLGACRRRRRGCRHPGAVEWRKSLNRLTSR